MKVIQVEQNRLKELFDTACKDLALNKCLRERDKFNSASEYKAALDDMHRKFMYVVRTLQSKIEDA